MGESATKGENAMKCIACGREMLDRGTHFECSNMLCDYEETIDAQEVLVKSHQWLPTIVCQKSGGKLWRHVCFCAFSWAFPLFTFGHPECVGYGSFWIRRYGGL